MKIKSLLGLLPLLFSGCFSLILAEELSIKQQHHHHESTDSDSIDNFDASDDVNALARYIGSDEIITECAPGHQHLKFNAIIVNDTGLPATIRVHYESVIGIPEGVRETLTVPAHATWVLDLAPNITCVDSKPGQYLYSIRAQIGGDIVRFRPNRPVPGGLFILKPAAGGLGFCFAGPIYEATPTNTGTFVNATGASIQVDIDYQGGGVCCESIKSRSTGLNAFVDGAYVQLTTKLLPTGSNCRIRRVTNRTVEPEIIIYGPELDDPLVYNGVFVFSVTDNDNNPPGYSGRYQLFPASRITPVPLS